MGFELTTLVMIGTDCTGSYKSNYHTITTTTAPAVKLRTAIKAINILINCCSCSLTSKSFLLNKIQTVSNYHLMTFIYIK